MNIFSQSPEQLIPKPEHRFEVARMAAERVSELDRLVLHFEQYLTVTEAPAEEIATPITITHLKGSIEEVRARVAEQAQPGADTHEFNLPS